MRMKTDRTSNSTGWLTKVSRLLIFTMMLCVFTGLGWHHPNMADAETLSAPSSVVSATSPRNATAAYVVMQRVEVNSVTGGANDGLVTLSSLTLDNIGTADVSAARVYLSTTATTTLPANAVQIGRTPMGGILSAATTTTIVLSSGTTTQRSVITGTPAYVYVLYDMLDTQTTRTAQSRVTGIGVASPDTGVTGLTYSSNAIYLPVNGLDATITSCFECHANPPVDSATRDAATGRFKGSHNKHAVSMSYACTICHASNTSTAHRTGSIGLLADFATYSGAYSKGTVSGSLKSFPQSTNPVMGSCSANYCHSSGTSNTSPFISNVTPTWADPPGAECTGCHSGGSQTTTRMSTGSHTKHLVNCSLCHNATVSDTTTVSAVSNHVNRKVDVRFTTTVAETTAQWRSLSAQTSTVSTTPGTSYATSSCSNIKCHSNGTGIWNGLAVTGTTPTWGAVLGCTNAVGCHGNATYLSDYRNMVSLYASTTAQVSGAKPNAHDPHITNGTVNAGETQCKHCHYSTTTTNTTIAAGGAHGNGAYTVGSFGTVTYPGGEDVSAALAVSMTYTFNAFAGVSACSNVSCHPNGVGGVKPSMPWNDKSATAYACANCHNINLTAAGGYHHSMGTTSYTPNPAAEADYPTTAPSGTWNTGTNPGSRTCLMCHVKHNIFSDRMNTNASLTQPRAMNLRTDIAQAPTQAANYTNTDFIGSGTYGICVSCHVNSLAKDQVRQKAEAGATSTPSVSGAVYSGSSHSYSVALITKTGAKTFNANCVKCHDAQNGETATFYTGTNLGTHDSTVLTNPVRRLLSALGSAATATNDSIEQNFCYRCHSQSTDSGNLATPGGGPVKSTANRDYYGGQAMSATSQYIWRDVKTASGSVASSTTTVVTTSGTSNWTAGQWVGYTLVINGGTGAGQGRRITAHTTGAAATITVTPAFTTTPAAGSTFTIGGRHNMELASGIHKPIEALNSSWSPSTSRHVECEDCHSPHATKDGRANASGTVAASGSTTTTLVASGTPNWPTDRWKGYLVNITTTGRGQARYVASNTANTLTIVGSFTAAPTAGDTFTLVSKVWESGGVATAGTATTLTDSSKSAVWTEDQWVGYFVKTVSGTGPEQVRAILSNTTTALTVNTWTVTPAAGTGYVIYQPPMVGGVNSGFGNVVNVNFETASAMTGTTGFVSAQSRSVSYSAKAGNIRYQYELCLTCHSTWAYGTEAGAPNVPTPYAQNAAADNFGTIKQQTDVGRDFDPDNYAYHPLFAPGKHQPIRMGNATGNAVGQTIAYNTVWLFVGTGGASTGGTAGGTVSATTGSNVITGSGTTFPLGAGAGWWIWINAAATGTGTPTNPTTTGIGGGGRGWWPVASRNSATQLTLAAPFNGTTGAGSSFYLTKGYKSTYVDGWGPESLVTCTDCHNTTDNIQGAANIAKARGPHGSANRWLLRFQEPQTVTGINGAVASTTVSNPLTYCLNCHSQLVYGDALIAGARVVGANNTYGRVNHATWNGACESNTDNGNYQQLSCTNCHGGQTATAGQAAVGTIHGNNIGIIGGANTPFGFRFQNGASWVGKRMTGTTGTGCYSATAVGSLSACGRAHDGSLTANYSY